MRVFRRRGHQSDRLVAVPLVVHIGLILALVISVAVVFGFGLWWGFGQPGIATDKSWTVNDSFDFLKIVLAVVGGIGGVVALVVFYRTQRLGGTARLFAEDFGRAVEQLGSTEAPVRMAGMYTLERLAQNTPEQRQTIANVFCAYLRMPYTPPEDDPAEEHRQDNERRKHEREVRLTAQRILANNLRTKTMAGEQTDDYWENIDLDLTGATLINLDFSSCRVNTASFEGAEFFGDARFVTAKFSGRAVFERAEFFGSAFFDGAKFSEFAVFREAEFFSSASFAGAKFSSSAAFFKGAKFSRHAAFNGAEFFGSAFFDGAEFSEFAVFDSAEFSGLTSFDGAKFFGHAVFIAVEFSEFAAFKRAEFSGHAVFDGVEFSGRAVFEGAQFHGSIRCHKTRVRLDVPDDVRQNRIWPPGCSVTEPTGPEEASLPGREGRWGYLTRVESDEGGISSTEDQYGEGTQP